ncbi:DUF2567 domain-containing protein [Micromonospora carbonacea]|uniref:DUF2567 domain-containing protein n=1 Tax=Micromonospora carbonacea TaxID=47853 RepID=UPI00370FC07C
MSPDTSDADRPAPRPDPTAGPVPEPPAAPPPDPFAGPLADPAHQPPAAPVSDPFAGPLHGPPAHQPPPGPFGAPPAGPVPADPAPPERRPGRVAGVALGAAALVTALGVPLGLLWAAVAPDTPVVKTAEGAVYAQPQPEQPIAADGWFSLLGLGFGVLAALGLWVLLRRRRGPVGLLAGAAGGLGAALVAWQVGRRVGLSAYERLLATAPDGEAFTKPADLRAGGLHRLFDVLPLPYGNLLLPAFGAAVTYTLLAGWSRWPSLRPEPEPDLSWAYAVPAGAGPQVSSGPVDSPAPTAAPEPPAPGAAGSPRG